MTREEWLLKATALMREDMFARQAATIPQVRVSVGFPGGSRGGKNVIGQIWHGAATGDSIPQVFISPIIDDPIQALEVLAHELVHACTPGDGHGAAFKSLATRIGLTGRMTATVAGPELRSQLETLAGFLGAFPHSAINLSDRKKQSTRMIKVECSCGFNCRLTRKWLEEVGAPICPACEVQMSEAGETESEAA